MEPRQVFGEFLQELAPERAGELLERFGEYHRLLVETNREINLISRRMPVSEYWTVHYLDSLLPLKVMDVEGLRILDFGTGGGLPGIPLALLRPSVRVTLLDSRQKKVNALKKIVNLLDLNQCTPFASRLEEFTDRQGPFDLVVCRSVRIEPPFLPHLRRLLRPGGRALFYKAHDESDLSGLRNPVRHDLSHPAVGTRIIVVHRREDLKER